MSNNGRCSCNNFFFFFSLLRKSRLYTKPLSIFQIPSSGDGTFCIQYTLPLYRLHNGFLFSFFRINPFKPGEIALYRVTASFVRSSPVGTEYISSSSSENSPKISSIRSSLCCVEIYCCGLFFVDLDARRRSTEIGGN